MTRPSATRPRCPRTDEAGAITVALIFVMVGSVLLMLVMAAITQELRKTSHDRSFTSALPSADIGVQQALNLLNSGQTASIPLTSSAARTGSAVQASGNTSYRWYADKDNVSADTPQSYTVHSSTTVNNVTRTVHVQLFQESQFRFALFADSGIIFDGNNNANSYPTSSGGQIATNGAIRLNGGGGSTSADVCIFYDTDTTPMASRAPSAGCTAMTGVAAKQDVSSASAMRFVTDQLAACASASPLTVYTGAALAAGSTYCFSSINLPRRAAPVISGTSASPTRIFVQGDIVMGIKTWLNYNGTTFQPDSAGLQIYSAGSTVNILGGSSLAAAIWAPQARCSGGAQVTIYGSLVCGNIDNVGGWTFSYDRRLTSVGGGGWKFRHYTEY